MQARSHHFAQPKSRSGGFEYALYFALVFAISLLPALLRMIAPRRGQPRRFFVTDAWSRAGEVTPTIFSAL